MLLRIENITKSFSNVEVLRNITLMLQEHQTLSILGKSGCGKTTLLKIIAGLLGQDNGDIFLNDSIINMLPSAKRNIVYLSQEPLLFPHLTVQQNIAFGLHIRKLPETTIRAKTHALIEQLGLEAHHNHLPHTLSGGQKQRVNFGRALIINPPVLLLDEPFSNLDAQTRFEMQLLFKDIAASYGMASIFVSHDLKETLLMGDTIGLMQEGCLQTFTDKNSFITDSRTGVQRELAFWKSLPS